MISFVTHANAPRTQRGDLAIAACKKALARVDAALDVDRLFVATVSPDYASPSCACIVQHALGLGQAPAFDVTTFVCQDHCGRA